MLLNDVRPSKSVLRHLINEAILKASKPVAVQKIPMPTKGMDKVLTRQAYDALVAENAVFQAMPRHPQFYNVPEAVAIAA